MLRDTCDTVICEDEALIYRWMSRVATSIKYFLGYTASTLCNAHAYGETMTLYVQRKSVFLKRSYSYAIQSVVNCVIIVTHENLHLLTFVV